MSTLEAITLKALDTGQVIYPSDTKYCEITPIEAQTSRITYRCYSSDTRISLIVKRLDPNNLSITVESYLTSPLSKTKCNLYLEGRLIIDDLETNIGKTFRWPAQTLRQTTEERRPTAPKPKIERPVSLTMRQVIVASRTPKIQPSPRTTIIVATPDIMGDVFPRCLANIRQNTEMEYQVVVIETHFIEELYNHARDMDIPLKGAESDYYVIMNDDLYVKEGWLEALIAPTLKDPTVGITGGLYLYPDGATIQHAGIYCDPDFDFEFGHRFHHRSIYLTPLAREETQVIGVTGALTLITKPCRESIGLWDSENFPLGWNDPDYCLRAWLAGWKVVYAPKCVAIHQEGLTLKAHSSQIKAHQTCFPNFQKKWSDETLSKIVKMVDDKLVKTYLKEIRG